jgi:hypothetical protein
MELLDGVGPTDRLVLNPTDSSPTATWSLAAPSARRPRRLTPKAAP